jgi:hypothetical protein
MPIDNKIQGSRVQGVEGSRGQGVKESNERILEAGYRGRRSKSKNRYGLRV